MLTSVKRSDTSLYVTRRVPGVHGLRRSLVGGSGSFGREWWITGFNLFGEVLGSCC